MRYTLFIIILIAAGIASCNNADDGKLPIETNKIEVDSTKQINRDTIIYPDTMASGVGF